MEVHKAANRWVARFMPVLLAGVTGYASWVVTHLVCGEDCLSDHLGEPEMADSRQWTT